ncbi:MAG: hypothetical protein Ct9H90mP22_3330 [Gammaproteobacteria bacterium]|nr:MAG: hypothetical protein Ct9H90mP22_3330 [Gammaproteobacteria bacterium]
MRRSSFEFLSLTNEARQKNICCHSRTFLFANKSIQDFPLSLFGSNELSKYLYISLLLPLAPIGVYAGAYLVDKINQEWFYRIGYFCTLIAGLKLVYDGLQSYM